MLRAAVLGDGAADDADPLAHGWRVLEGAGFVEEIVVVVGHAQTADFLGPGHTQVAAFGEIRHEAALLGRVDEAGPIGALDLHARLGRAFPDIGAGPIAPGLLFR